MGAMVLPFLPDFAICGDDLGERSCRFCRNLTWQCSWLPILPLLRFGWLDGGDSCRSCRNFDFCHGASLIFGVRRKDAALSYGESGVVFGLTEL